MTLVAMLCTPSRNPLTWFGTFGLIVLFQATCAQEGDHLPATASEPPTIVASSKSSNLWSIDMGKQIAATRSEFGIQLPASSVAGFEAITVEQVSCACLMVGKPSLRDGGFYLPCSTVWPGFHGDAKVVATISLRGKDGKTVKGHVAVDYVIGEYVDFEGGTGEVLSDIAYTSGDSASASFLFSRGVFKEWDEVHISTAPDSFFETATISALDTDRFQVLLSGPRAQARTRLGRQSESLTMNFLKGGKVLPHTVERRISWMVTGPLRASPSQCDFGVVKRDALPGAISIRLSPRKKDQNQPFKILSTDITVGHGHLASNSVRAVVNGSQVDVQLLLTPATNSDPVSQAIIGSITIKAQLADDQVFDIRVPINAIIE